VDENSFHHQQVVLVRHGDTEWALEGRHTGRTDVPLTERGRRQAASLARLLRGKRFAKVLVSPRQRALETCRMAGFGDLAEIRGDLAEWDYGEYEGRTTPEILAERPGWTLWEDGVPGGETVEDVGHRVDRVIAEVQSTPGDVAIFAHGHVLRILTARWLGLGARDGRLFMLDPAGVSVLGYEHTWAVIARWNETPASSDEEDHHDIAAAL
jgi:broad specificity phosphatase PhoE